MLRKILVPIAFSPYSRGILKYAISLARPHGARLLIANVVNEKNLEAVEKIAGFGYKVDGDRYIATVQEERVRQLEELLAELGIGEDEYDYSFLVGDPTSELLQLVLKEKIDLVVMGIRTRELRHIFAGSVAERMFRRCPVPLLSFRGEDTAKELERKIRKEMGKKH